MDAFNPQASTVAEYMQATPAWRTDLYADKGTLLTHAESIELFKQLGVKFTPELKAPEVPMPNQGDYSQADYAKLIRASHLFTARQPAKLLAFQLEDLLLMATPVNIPGTSTEYPNWRRKLVENIDHILQRDDVLQLIAEIKAARQ